MKEMRLLGMNFKDYSVKEAMHLVDSFLTGSRVGTISFLSMDSCLEASNNDDMKIQLQAMDMCIPTTPEILNAAGIAGHSRIKEIEESKFYKELLKKLSGEKRTAFILAEDDAVSDDCESHLNKNASGIKIAGKYVIKDSSENVDLIVNEINATFPDVVFSRLSSPKQEQFIYEQKSRLNAKLWIALKDSTFQKDDGTEADGFRKLLVKILFRLKAGKFINTRR